MAKGLAEEVKLSNRHLNIAMLTQAQIDQYQKDGYLVLRNQFDH